MEQTHVITRVDLIPRMRTLPELVSECKAIDPNTQVSEHFVRSLISNGFPVIKTGRRFMLNLDLFIDYLNGNYSFN